MQAIVLAGPPAIEVQMRRSARARRITLRVSSLDGRVTLTLPAHVSEREAVRFAREKEDWVRGHLSRQPGDVVVAASVEIPIEGVPHIIRSGAGRQVRMTDGVIEVPGNPTRMGARLAGYLKTLARDRLVARSDHYAKLLGLPYSSISLRDTRSRWGSCSSAGKLMFSWRLIMAPSDVLDYVAAHEVAHLAEMNHSPAFWARVEDIHGPYKNPRRWLRQNGASLHRYRFGN